DRRAVDEQDELVAAETRDGVLGTYERPEALSDDAKDIVPDAVSVGVVDGFESVHVNADDGQPVVMPAACRLRLIKALDEQSAVGSPVRKSWVAEVRSFASS